MSKIDTPAVIAEALLAGHPVANEKNVKEMVDALLQTFDAETASSRYRDLSNVDVMMIAANFNRMLVQHLEKELGFEDKDTKRAFRMTMLATLERSFMKRLEDA